MKSLREKITAMLAQNALSFSDIHIGVGKVLRVRIPRGVVPVDEDVVTKDQLLTFLSEFGPSSMEEWQDRIDSNGGQYGARFQIGDTQVRAALFNSGGDVGRNRQWSLALRVLPKAIPVFSDLGLPEAALELFKRESGLVIVTGITGSGKSTTMAAAIDHLNANFNHRIITLEDPMEYIHQDQKSMITQRQLVSDFSSFAVGVKQAMREDPNIIVVGEVNDLESMKGAMSAALSGHLVITSMHTLNAFETVNRIIDLYPPDEKAAVRSMIAQVLVGVVSQKLLPSTDGKRYHLAHEIMGMNDAIRTSIRDDKLQMIPNEIDKRKPLMHVLNSSLAQLVDSDKVSLEVAKAASYKPEQLDLYLGLSLEEELDVLPTLKGGASYS